MSGSVHNTEVYRCSECQDVVVLVPEGFVIGDLELEEKTHEHAKTCAPLRERIARAQD